MTTKRFLAWSALLFGTSGIVACAAAVVCVLLYGGRLAGVNADVFAGMDKSLTAVHGRVQDVRRRVQDMTTTTGEVGAGLKNRTQRQAAERVASRLNIEEKAGQLAQGMERAGQLMEMSEASLQGLAQTFEAVGSMGVPVDGALFDPLIGKVSALRGGFEQATGVVEGIRERAADLDAAEPRQERVEQAVQLVDRVVATMSDLESKLTELADKVSAMQTKGQSLRARIAIVIRAAQLVAILALVWMAAGQASLYSLGRSSLRLSGHPDPEGTFQP